MAKYLVGIMYHEPASFALWNRGVIEDYESSTGIFIDADSTDAAIEWGEKIGQELLRHVNDDPTLDWKSFDYYCWIVQSPVTSNWSHCLDFFQHVSQGQLPALEQMTSESYGRWIEENPPKTGRRPQRGVLKILRDAALQCLRQRSQ